MAQNLYPEVVNLKKTIVFVNDTTETRKFLSIYFIDIFL